MVLAFCEAGQPTLTFCTIPLTSFSMEAKGRWRRCLFACFEYRKVFSVTSYNSFMLYKDKSRKAPANAVCVAAAAGRERWHTERVERSTGGCPSAQPAKGNCADFQLEI